MGSAIDPEILRNGIMIPLIVGAGIIGKFLYDINESHSMEEEAEEKGSRPLPGKQKDGSSRNRKLTACSAG